MIVKTVAKTLEESGDFVHLAGDTEYHKYFDLLLRASTLLGSWYQRVVDGAGDEEKIVSSFLNKLLYTIKLLSLKHSCGDEPKLRLDLNGSGYPHLIGIMAVESDLRRRSEELRSIDSQPVLKQAMLAHMFEKNEEPTELLATMSLRRYFEFLDESKILLPFTPGELLLKTENETSRNYVFSWVCYDVNTNVPHVYIMSFDQDKIEEPLHNGGSSHARFMDVVRGEGSRVPALDIVAIGIDNCIESIHPKILKRIKLGPLVSVAYSREEHPLLAYLRTYGEEGDFAFHIRDEMVYSQRQVQKKSGWLTSGEVREIFAVPRDNAECSEAGVSRINRMLLLPHHIMQNLDHKDPAIKQYNVVVAYTKKGEIYAV